MISWYKSDIYENPSTARDFLLQDCIKGDLNDLLK